MALNPMAEPRASNPPAMDCEDNCATAATAATTAKTIHEVR